MGGARPSYNGSRAGASNGRSSGAGLCVLPMQKEPQARFALGVLVEFSHQTTRAQQIELGVGGGLTGQPIGLAVHRRRTRRGLQLPQRFYTRASLVPNSFDHNHSSGKSGAKG